MDDTLFTKLHEEGVLSEGSLLKIKARVSGNLFSLHWEIKTLLYLGVLLLSGGLGILVYKNIDSIGHQAILLFIALVCIGCFYYCLKHKAPFSTQRVLSPNVVFDYLLLLGCLSFIIFIGYLQYQYTVFGNRYGLATFIPMVLLFISAYYFDHLGVLSMAITNLAAWMGITVTPLEILKANGFNNTTIILTGLLLGALLISASLFSKKRDLKKHFEFTYNNFGMQIIFISCLAALFEFESIYLLGFLVLLGISWYFYTKALNDRSFYILLVTTLYTYIGLSYVFIRLLDGLGSFFSEGVIYAGLIYFIASGIGMVLFLIRTNKKMKANDRI
ncbi:MAG: DUF2157 domain-containing protein [Ferruginibacter sp.]